MPKYAADNGSSGSSGFFFYCFSGFLLLFPEVTGTHEPQIVQIIMHARKAVGIRVLSAGLVNHGDALKYNRP